MTTKEFILASCLGAAIGVIVVALIHKIADWNARGRP